MTKPTHSTLIRLNGRRPGKTTTIAKDLIAKYGFCFQSNDTTLKRILATEETRQRFYASVGISGNQEVGWMIMRWLPDGEIRVQPAGEVVTLDSLSIE